MDLKNLYSCRPDGQQVVLPNRKAKISSGLGIRGLQLVKAAHVAEYKVMLMGGKQVEGSAGKAG